MSALPVATETGIEPAAKDIDEIVRGLESSWTATITVRRQSQEDVGYREIAISLDSEQIAVLHDGEVVTREVAPGPHLSSHK